MPDGSKLKSFEQFLTMKRDIQDLLKSQWEMLVSLSGFQA